MSIGASLKLYAVSCSGWVFHVAAWFFLLESWTFLRDLDYFAVCAFYSFSWLVGYLTMITPGGLGVREFVFFNAAGQSIEQNSLILVSAIARIWLIAVDAILFLLFLVLGRAASSKPRYDCNGINITDPFDIFGVKTDYITEVHKKAYMRHVPRGSGGLAIDAGCGWGRMTSILQDLGYDPVGFDPDASLLRLAMRRTSGIYCAASLPDLPIQQDTAELIVFQNLLRPLLLIGKLDCVRGVSRFLRPGGRIVVVDNIRKDHRAYVSDEFIRDLFMSEGLELRLVATLRTSRRFHDYLMQVGLIPRRLIASIAERELSRSENSGGVSGWRYSNVMYIFQKGANL